MPFVGIAVRRVYRAVAGTPGCSQELWGGAVQGYDDGPGPLFAGSVGEIGSESIQNAG